MSLLGPSIFLSFAMTQPASSQRSQKCELLSCKLSQSRKKDKIIKYLQLKKFRVHRFCCSFRKVIAEISTNYTLSIKLLASNSLIFIGCWDSPLKNDHVDTSRYNKIFSVNIHVYDNTTFVIISQKFILWQNHLWYVQRTFYKKNLK